MKIFLVLLLFCSSQLMSQGSLYELRLESLDGSTVSLGDFKDRKILVASASPANLEKGGLLFLDSLQTAFPGVKMIVVPAEDFGGDRNTAILQSFQSRPADKVTISSAAFVSRKSPEKQQPLMKWLTQVTDYTHFDRDVSTDFQLYVISESGVLYALLGKGVPVKIISQVLNQPDVKE